MYRQMRQLHVKIGGYWTKTEANPLSIPTLDFPPDDDGKKREPQNTKQDGIKNAVWVNPGIGAESDLAED